MDDIQAQIEEIGPKFHHLVMLRSAAYDARRCFGDYDLPVLSRLAERISDIWVDECGTRETSFFIGERHFQFFYDHRTLDVWFLEFTRASPNRPWLGDFRETSDLPKLVDLLLGEDECAHGRALAVFLLEALAQGYAGDAIPELRVGTDIPDGY